MAGATATGASGRLTVLPPEASEGTSITKPPPLGAGTHTDLQTTQLYESAYQLIMRDENIYVDS